MAKVLRLFVIFFSFFYLRKSRKWVQWAFVVTHYCSGSGFQNSSLMCYRFLNNVCLLVVSYNDYSTWYLIKKIKMSVEKSFKMPLNEIFLTIFVRMCLGHSGRFTFRPLVRSFENSHPFFSLMQNSSSNKANKQKNIPFLHDY